MERTIIAYLKVDDNRAFQEIGDGPLHIWSKSLRSWNNVAFFFKMPRLPTRMRPDQKKHILSTLPNTLLTI